MPSKKARRAGSVGVCVGSEIFPPRTPGASKLPGMFAKFPRKGGTENLESPFVPFRSMIEFRPVNWTVPSSRKEIRSDTWPDEVRSKVN